MEKIKRWLDKECFNYREVELNYHDKIVRGVMVDTNYNGEHPNPIVLSIHAYIDNHISRFYKGFRTESRGHYTGLLIISNQ